MTVSTYILLYRKRAWALSPKSADLLLGNSSLYEHCTHLKPIGNENAPMELILIDDNGRLDFTAIPKDMNRWMSQKPTSPSSRLRCTLVKHQAGRKGNSKQFRILTYYNSLECNLIANSPICIGLSSQSLSIPLHHDGGKCIKRNVHRFPLLLKRSIRIACGTGPRPGFTATYFSPFYHQRRSSESL